MCIRDSNLTDSSCAVGPQAQRTRTILGVQSHRTLYSHCKKKKGKKENERESKGMNVLFKIFIFVVFMFVIFLNFFSFSYFFKCRMRTSVYWHVSSETLDKHTHSIETGKGMLTSGTSRKHPRQDTSPPDKTLIMFYNVHTKSKYFKLNYGFQINRSTCLVINDIK